jgi:Flp pilus assembly protein TadG
MKKLAVRTLLCSQRGSALVEFAITGLLFFALIFAIFEASRAIYHYNIIASVAREGTRFAAVRGSQSGRVASRADIQAFVRSRALGLDPTVNVNWSPTNDPGAIIEVRVRHTFTTIVPLAGVPNMNMSSTARSIMVR